MTLEEVIKFFGGKANTARELDITYQAVQDWERRGTIPRGRQFEIQVMTGGRLQADSSENSDSVA